MTRFLITASVLALVASGASAQQTVLGATANAGGGNAIALDTNDNARSAVTGEIAAAEVSNGGSRTAEQSAQAIVGDGVAAFASGNETGGSNIAAVDANQQSANVNVQFQQGNDNNAINMQVGNFQESATLQIGSSNMGLISQTDSANEAAVSQVGDNNTAIVAQEGDDNGGVVAQLGDGNSGMIAQSGGPDNYAAIAQVGTSNSSIALQAGDNNTIATLQEGTSNSSFVSQGAGLSFELTAIDLTTSVGGSLSGPAAVTGTGLASLGAIGNSAASLQLGTNNVSAIVQTGGGNNAVNYQSNR